MNHNQERLGIITKPDYESQSGSIMNHNSIILNSDNIKDDSNKDDSNKDDNSAHTDCALECEPNPSKPKSPKQAEPTDKQLQAFREVEGLKFL